MNRPIVRTLGAVAALAIALSAGFFLGRAGHTPPTPGQPDSEPAPAERAVLYWYDPMVPGQRFDKPGKSPFMDMMLVPRYADEVSAAGVRIDPGVRQNLGIRTAQVAIGQLRTELRVPGTLQWDLRGEQRVAARVEAQVERVHVRAPFEPVRAGQPLATLLAPALSSALAEYRALADGESAAARELGAAARSRLRLLGLGEADLRGAVGADGAVRIVLRAPSDGVLAEIGAREGDTVMAGQTLFRLNRTATLWLEVALPQAEAAAVRPGMAADIAIAGFPGERFDGVVETVLPESDPLTRVRRARIVLDDPQGRLAAGMYAEVVLRPDPGEPRPLLPTEALILDGREARTLVLADDGAFVPTTLRLGRRSGDLVEVLEGLQGEEWVVVSGQFLIDSEANLTGALRRLGEEPEAAHEHEHAPEPDDDAHGEHR